MLSPDKIHHRARERVEMGGKRLIKFSRNSFFFKRTVYFGVHVLSLRSFVKNERNASSATVRYATRITTESSHLHHKVQGFHTPNS